MDSIGSGRCVLPWTQGEKQSQELNDWQLTLFSGVLAYNELSLRSGVSANVV